DVVGTVVIAAAARAGVLAVGVVVIGVGVSVVAPLTCPGSAQPRGTATAPFFIAAGGDGQKSAHDERRGAECFRVHFDNPFRSVGVALAPSTSAGEVRSPT